MKAFIFAAGLGTRLKPITDTIPKALLEIQNQTLLEILILKLKRSNISEIVINVHHFATKIVDYLKAKNNFGTKINISDESLLLLDTGGGLINASGFFDKDENILIHNADILSDIDFNAIEELHIKNNSLVSLVVNKRKTTRYLLFNKSYELCGWENITTGERIIVKDKYENLFRMAFSGISIVNSKLFDLYKTKGVFSIVKMYLELAKDNRISGLDFTQNKWFDVGKISDIDRIKEINVSEFS